MTRALTAFGLLFLGLVAGLVLSEIGYRIARRYVCVGDVPGTPFDFNADYGWSHRPKSAAWAHGCLGTRYEWRQYSTINSAGLRDREHAVAKPPDTLRVLLLGDSITEAAQVPLEQSFAALLEAELQGSGRRIEVINAGTAGYSTDNELRFFDSEGARYEPDIVVLVLNLGNDVLENSSTLQRRLYALAATDFARKQYYRLDGGKPVVDATAFRPGMIEAPRPSTFGGRLGAAVEKNFYLVRLAERAIRRWRGVVPDEPSKGWPIFDVYATPIDDEWRSAWQLTNALVGALRDDVEARGARFLVAVMPGREAVVLDRDRPAWAALQPDRAWDLDQPTRLATDYLQSAGIRFQDLLPALREDYERTGTRGFYVRDIHLTPHGHRVVANVLRSFLAAEISRLEAALHLDLRAELDDLVGRDTEELRR